MGDYSSNSIYISHSVLYHTASNEREREREREREKKKKRKFFLKKALIKTHEHEYIKKCILEV